MTDADLVLYEIDGPIARLTLNDPKHANAQTSAMVHAFDDALTQAEQDYRVKVVIIRANGKGFCGGHAVPAPPGTYPEFEEEIEHFGTVWKSHGDLFHAPTVRLVEFPKPTIAQVHGYAIGGGTYWALLPDLTIASEDAYFQMPLVQGMGFSGGETMIEPWLMMNWKRAYQYLYTSQTLTAAEALEFGMLNEVVPREDLQARTEELAAHIARAPLSTLMGTKQLVMRAWEQMGMRTHWRMSNDMMTVLGNTKDAVQLRERLIAGGGRPRDLT